MRKTEPNRLLEEPLEALVTCHRHIEAQLATLERLAARVSGSEAGAEAKAAARAVREYFDTSGALHHEDEDKDLFPLLRVRAARQGRPAIAAAIDELERQHESIDVQWQRLRARLTAFSEGEGSLDPDEIARFAWLYRRHMDRESAAVLPFAREALDADQRAALGERMAARRKSAQA